MTFQQYPFKGGIPSGNTAGRPGSPVIGDTYYNGQLEILEIYNGTEWVAVSAPPSTPTITSVTDSSTTDAYASTAGKLTVVMAAGSGGGTPSQYNVFTTSGGHSASSSTSTITLTGLTPGTAYTVYGNAQNNFGTTVNTGNFAETTPTTLPAVPTSVTASSATTNSVIVSWTAPANNGGKAISQYIVTPFIGATAQTTTTTTGTSVTVTGLTGGTTYTFKVKATNANGNSADSTASSSISTLFPIEVLVVAGGGGGGGGHDSDWFGGGAGGGGGIVYHPNLGVAKATAYSITVGNGGSKGLKSPQGSTSATSGSVGGDSVAFSLTAKGGGFGSKANTSNDVAGNGGSGGGGSSGASGPNNYGTSNQGSFTGATSYGNRGGTVTTTGQYPYGAGGGGATAVGGDINQSSSMPVRGGGDGGAGLTSSISGSSQVYGSGGGGGGAGNASGTGGNGGTGGTNAGNGGSPSSLNATDATANFGGGGGGGSGGPSSANGDPGDGGAGGSGVVIIKYADSIAAASATTGSPTITTSGGYRYYKFTGDGSITW